MKPGRPRHLRSSERGAALLAALCFAAVLAIALSSYITLCHRTLELSTRAFQGNRSAQLAETGMEEVVWSLNRNDWSGWTFNGTTATKTISGLPFDHGATGRIDLEVTNYDGSGGTRTLTVTATVEQADGETARRTLTATSKPAPLFVNAIAATDGKVTFASSGVVDSYDTSIGGYTAQAPGYSAVVTSTQLAPDTATVRLTNAQVRGYVTSYYTGGPSYSTSATLAGPSTPPTTKVDDARINYSAYQPVFSVKSITGAGTILGNPAENSTVVLGSPTDTVPRIYYFGQFDLTGTTKVIVDGPVQLVAMGVFYIGRWGGSQSIEITSNGKLEVFIAGYGGIGGGGIVNNTEDPSKLAIYAQDAWPLTVSTTTPLHGVVYAPGRDIAVSGETETFGAIVAKSVAFSGSEPKVHYDVRLRDAVFSGIDTPYAISDWREVANDL